MLPIALVLFAGLMYEFETVIQSQYGTRRYAGAVTVDGIRYRVDLPDSIVISIDGDETASIYDSGNGQWWERKRAAVTRSSLLFALPRPGSRIEGAPVIGYRRDGEELFEGYVASRHLIEIDYTLAAEVLDEEFRGDVRAVARVWAIESLPSLPMKSEVRTGFARIDAALEQAAANVKGMIVRHELEVTRTIEGGAAVTETTKTVARNIREAAIPDETFTRARTASSPW